MPDLSTTYLGLQLSSPLVPSASPLSKNLDNLKRLEDAGAAAVVMYSLFEEQITRESYELDYFLSHGSESQAEAASYLPEPEAFFLTPEKYLEHIRRAKEAVDMPIIGSLNGVSRGGWTKYAKLIEEAGADALELNIYYVPTDPYLPSHDIEAAFYELVKDVKRDLTIPVAVKLSPYFTNLAYMARRLDEAGADALVLFNRFYQPDIDLETLEIVPRASLSTSHTPNALRLPLTWIGILYGHLKAQLALTSGVHSAEDVLKGLMVGASVTMLASELLLNGIPRLAEIKADLIHWLETHEYESVAQLRGSMSQKSIATPAAFERAQYMRAITINDPLIPS
jgi:dihydroorotate dehydrogenase (fumarate)